MNLADSTKLAEGSVEREEAIYHLAKRMAMKDKSMSPITLELTNTSVADFTIGGFDVFKLIVHEVTDGGRVREQRDLRIADEFMSFIYNQAYTGLMKIVPATENNLKLLASHAAGQKWMIHEEDWREKVEEIAKTLKPIRDEIKEMTAPEFMPHVDKREEELRKKRLEELERQIHEKELLLQDKAREMAASQAETTTPQAEPEAMPEPEPMDDPDFDEPDFDGTDDEDVPAASKPLDSIYETAREQVLQKHAAEIEEMKKRGIKRIDMTKEYKEWMKEELNPVSA